MNSYRIMKGVGITSLMLAFLAVPMAVSAGHGESHRGGNNNGGSGEPPGYVLWSGDCFLSVDGPGTNETAHTVIGAADFTNSRDTENMQGKVVEIDQALYSDKLETAARKADDIIVKLNALRCGGKKAKIDAAGYSEITGAVEDIGFCAGFDVIGGGVCSD